jgi:hypothetical protein
MDDEAGTVTLSKDDFKAVMGKLGGHKQVAKRSQSNLILLAFGYLAVSIGFIAVIVGLMNWRIEASKESHVKGGTLVGKDGEAVKAAELLSFASIYDIAKLDVQTILKTRHASLEMEHGESMSLTITGATKRAGSSTVRLLTPGGVVLIDGNAMKASVTVDSRCYVVKAPTSEETRRLRSTEGRQLVHSPEEFRNLAEKMTGGYAELSLAVGKSILDAIDTSQVVSGLADLQIPSPESERTYTMGLRFMANARVTGNAYDTDCRMNPEIVNDPGKVVFFGIMNEPLIVNDFSKYPTLLQSKNMTAVNNSNQVVYMDDEVSIMGHRTASGTIVVDICKSQAAKTNGEFLKSSDPTSTDDGADIASFFGESVKSVSNVIKDTEFFPIDVNGAAIVDMKKQCNDLSGGGLPNTNTGNRRLNAVPETEEELAEHFETYYHSHIRAEHQAHVESGKTVPRHLKEAKEHATVIEYMYGVYEQGRRLSKAERERRLSSWAGNLAKDAYGTPSGYTCSNGGYFCTSGCTFVFKGTSPTSWDDVKADLIPHIFDSTVNVGGEEVANKYQNYKDGRYGAGSKGCSGTGTYIGHSLGGAMATYHAQQYGGNADVYTYGGLGIYSNYNSCRNKNWGGYRMVHECDPAAKSVMGMNLNAPAAWNLWYINEEWRGLFWDGWDYKLEITNDDCPGSGNCNCKRASSDNAIQLVRAHDIGNYAKWAGRENNKGWHDHNWNDGR